MRSAFCTNVFRPEQMEAALRHLAASGFQAVEFWQQCIDIGQERTTETDDAARPMG